MRQYGGMVGSQRISPGVVATLLVSSLFFLGSQGRPDLGSLIRGLH